MSLDGKVICKIQDYQQFYASLECQPVLCSKFTAYFHEMDSRPTSNFAIPNFPIISDITRELQLLREQFTFRGLKPRIEFLAEYTPSLVNELRSCHFFEEMRAPLVCCRFDTFRDIESASSITIREITRSSPLSDVKSFLTVQRACFGLSTVYSEADIAAYRDAVVASPFLALLDDTPVGVVLLGPVYKGIAEVIGLATIQSFRRRGVATALLTTVFRRAFENGIELIFGSAGTEYSFRAMTKIGSFPFATLLGYGWRSVESDSSYHVIPPYGCDIQ